jgi:hypothetical protein
MYYALNIYTQKMTNTTEKYNDNNNEETELNSCLVICIDEYDDDGTIDTRVFVSYNEAEEMYIINGKRLDIAKNDKNVKSVFFQPFMFCAESSNDVLDFLSLILDIKRTFSYTLFNYNNLSYDKNDITYSFMEENIDRRYEIAAYDHVTYSRKIFRQLVRVTKLMYNKI